MNNSRNRRWQHRLGAAALCIGVCLGLWSTLFYLINIVRPSVALAAPAQSPYALCDTVQGIPVSECEGLVDFYNSTGGDGWHDNSGWLQSNTPCVDWIGVSCFSGSITGITLVSNTLTGSLPSTINKLPSLRRLEVRNNQISGTLPSQLSDLAALQVLMLTNNQLSGDLATINWDNFRQMIDLRLDGNDFSGQIPAVFGEMEQLQKLHISGDKLTGKIPNTFGAYCNSGVGGMCKMTELRIGGLQLTGMLPSSLGNLHNMQAFVIYNTRFTGTIPTELGAWTKVDTFIADYNNFQGDLSVFAKMTALITLRLSGNFFTGTIPSGFGALTNLKTLWLGANQLRGAVPKQVACLPNIETNPYSQLSLGDNMLFIDEEEAKACLSQLANDGDYRSVLGHQTVPPSAIRVGDVNDRYVELQWEPIYRAYLAGYYEIAYTQSKSESPVYAIRTADQTTARYQVKNLAPGTDYYFYIRTYTPPTGLQKNALTSWANDPPIKVRTPGLAPSLTFTKEVTPTIAAPGQEVIYRLTLLSNEGASTVALTDTLPTSVTVIGAPSGGAQFIGDKLYYAGSLQPNIPYVFEYRAIVGKNVAAGSILFSAATAVRTNGEAPEKHLATASVAVAGQSRIETLVLIYASGDNDLSEPMRELFQKAESANIPDGMVVLLLYDGAEQGDAYYYRLQHDTNLAEYCPVLGNLSCNGRYQENVTMWHWDEDVGTYASLREFIVSAMQAYPADTVILSLVGHGSGWSPDFLGEQPTTHDEKPDNRFYGGVLWDKNPESALSTAQLRAALDEAKAKTGQTIDLLYLDSCLMAMSEVVYELKNSVDYVLASESTSWTSFRYDLHLSWDASPHDIKMVGQQWIADEIRELSPPKVAVPYTFALMDLTGTKATKLISLENNLAFALVDVLKHDPTAKSRVQQAADAAECMDSNQDHTIDQQDYYCDLYSFASQVITVTQTPAVLLDANFAAMNRTVITAATALRDFLDPAQGDFILAEAHSSVEHPYHAGDSSWRWGKLGGLSIYLPLRSATDDWKRRYYGPAYLQSAADGYWDELLDAYWNYATPPADPAPCRGCTPRGQDPLPGGYQLFLPVVQK
ncbi:MAG: clostripain-related cysteine peptidase [Caldilineaceae bacterium]